MQMKFDPKDLLDKKWPLLGLVNGVTFITLCTLFFKNANNAFSGANYGENGDGNNNRQWKNENGEWDIHMDFKEEEAQGFAVVLVPFILIVGCLSLIVPALKVWHPSTGSISKIPVGMLTASQFMFGQMLFISYWFLSDFQREQQEEEQQEQGNDRRLEEEQGNYEYNQDGYGYYQMTEEELLAQRQKVTRNILLVLAVFHMILSGYLLDWGRKLSSSSAATPTAATTATGDASLFMEIWKFASKLSIGILSIQTFGIFVCFFTEQGQRMLEEGSLIANAFAVAVWTLVLTGITNFIGHMVLVKKTWTDTLAVGALAGCQTGLGWTFFMVFFLYCFAAAGARMEGMRIAGPLSACALFLWGVYSFMGKLTLKYSDSIAAGINQNTDEASDYVRDFDEENNAPKGEAC